MGQQQFRYFSTQQKLVYEISIQADTAIASEYATFLKDHVNSVLTTVPGFLSAQIGEQDAAEAKLPLDKRYFVVLFQVASKKHLDDHFTIYMPKLRQQSAPFAGKFSATTKILYLKE